MRSLEILLMKLSPLVSVPHPFSSRETGLYLRKSTGGGYMDGDSHNMILIVPSGATGECIGVCILLADGWCGDEDGQLGASRPQSAEILGQARSYSVQ